MTKKIETLADVEASANEMIAKCAAKRLTPFPVPTTNLDDWRNAEVERWSDLEFSENLTAENLADLTGFIQQTLVFLHGAKYDAEYLSADHTPRGISIASKSICEQIERSQQMLDNLHKKVHATWWRMVEEIARAPYHQEATVNTSDKE